MNALAVVDSGTTNTRLRLVRGAKIEWSGARPVGARDTAREGRPASVLAALRELLREMPQGVDAVICSGMITSNMGLLEVPHLPTPISLDQIAASLVTKCFPELDDIALTFIPGVKTLPASTDFRGIGHADIVRGEETEIAGILTGYELSADSVFVHFGSHHKAIDVSVNGTITGSRTSMTGELLAAVSERTILKGSLVPLDAVGFNMEAALAGADAAEDYGLGKALFMVRVGEQLGGRSKDEMTNFAIGALATLSVSLLKEASRQKPVVLYGQGAFPSVVEQLLQREGFSSVTLIPDEVSLHCAALGAVELYGRSQRLGVRQ